MDYSIKINEFEGPLDLLLHLIKQSNIDIYDIEISVITKQYLDYINKMEELNINIAASYIVMAAELMEIKSKSLLPQKEEENDEEEYIFCSADYDLRGCCRAWLPGKCRGPWI